MRRLVLFSFLHLGVLVHSFNPQLLATPPSRLYDQQPPVTVLHAKRLNDQRRSAFRRTISLDAAASRTNKRTISLGRRTHSLMRLEETSTEASQSLVLTRGTDVKSSALALTSGTETTWNDIRNRLAEELKETFECASLAAEAVFSSKVTAEDIVRVCDTIDELSTTSNEDLFVSGTLELRKRALEFKRHELLAKLMANDYEAYIATASFLSPSRIPRAQLPNVQDVPIDKNAPKPDKWLMAQDGSPLVADCELDDMKYQDSPLDKLLLGVFRKLVEKNTGGVQSDKPGIEGLLDQGRTFMLQPGQTAEAQNKMVYDTLGGLMTPALPPFYRLFMSGIIPKVGSDFDGKQIGPWFYAPALTAFVTPPFFGFLVGPSTPNRRKDGQPGGLLVEKCKFLQESGCKGLCLNQCKIPAQNFFQEELGLPLTISPNFVTQECQWSFGEVPLPPGEDPYFPKGCLSGCESRKALAGTSMELCS